MIIMTKIQQKQGFLWIMRSLSFTRLVLLPESYSSEQLVQPSWECAIAYFNKQY